MLNLPPSQLQSVVEEKMRKKNSLMMDKTWNAAWSLNKVFKLQAMDVSSNKGQQSPPPMVGKISWMFMYDLKGG